MLASHEAPWEASYTGSGTATPAISTQQAIQGWYGLIEYHVHKHLYYDFVTIRSVSLL
jgi:hypothetical protein